MKLNSMGSVMPVTKLVTPAASNMQDHLRRLTGEVEDHVHVERLEHVVNVLDALYDLLGAAVLVVAVHALEQRVVEALHAHREALHHVGEALQALAVQVRRVGLAGDLGDSGEQFAHVVDGALQLIHHDGGRAAADVCRGRLVAQIVDGLQFLAQGFEVAAAELLLKREACERAIWA